jgi:hypothetical protein
LVSELSNYEVIIPGVRKMITFTLHIERKIRDYFLKPILLLKERKNQTKKNKTKHHTGA